MSLSCPPAPLIGNLAGPPRIARNTAQGARMEADSNSPCKQLTISLLPPRPKRAKPQALPLYRAQKLPPRKVLPAGRGAPLSSVRCCSVGGVERRIPSQAGPIEGSEGRGSQFSGSGVGVCVGFGLGLGFFARFFRSPAGSFRLKLIIAERLLGGRSWAQNMKRKANNVFSNYSTLEAKDLIPNLVMPRNQTWNLLNSFLNSNVRKSGSASLDGAWDICTSFKTL